jgi:hypothetical protein
MLPNEPEPPSLSFVLPNEPEPPSLLRGRSDDEPHTFGAGGVGLSPHGKAPLHPFQHPIRLSATGKFSQFSLSSYCQDYNFHTETKLFEHQN